MRDRRAKLLAIGLCCTAALLADAGAVRAQTTAPTTAPIAAPSTGPSTSPVTLPATASVIEHVKTQWIDSFEDAFSLAQKQRTPLLVFVYEGNGEKLSSLWEDAINNPIVPRMVRTWPITRLRPDARENMRMLAIASVPAARVVSDTGRVLAKLDGTVDAVQLAKWLADAAKISTPASETIDVATWIKALSSSDANAREAGVRQLSARAKDAAAAVIDLLSREDLTARVSAADLLISWGAPMDGIDPWHRASVSPERLKLLSSWAATLEKASTTQSAPELSSATSDLDLLLAASTTAEAQVIRERLARYGESLLPEIYQRISTAKSETARTRLAATRYRIVATDKLAAAFPGGFERIASIDAATRRSAMRELLDGIAPTDTRLLVELFGSDDAYIREHALHALKSLGGAETTAALLKLLHDPDPNVRAAVLNLLAEQKDPNPVICSELAKYVAGETNPDLVVHAVRAFRMMQSEEASTQLIGLTSHSNWQVRGEAVEALRESIVEATNELKAKACIALIKCLDDEEGYVVGQAVTALAKQDLGSAVDPMLKAAVRHPPMAGEILGIIARNRTLQATAAPKMIELLNEKSAEVRAAALISLCQLSPQAAGKYLVGAIASDNTKLQLTAVRGALLAPHSLRPGADKNDYQAVEAAAKIDLNKWLGEFKKKTKPAWLKDLTPHLTRIASEKGEAALPAAIALAADGETDKAMPVLLESAKSRQLVEPASAALRWLEWNEREALFNALVATADSTGRLHALSVLAEIADVRASNLVWNLLRDDAKPDNALREAAFEALRTQYFGSNYWNTSELAPEKLEKSMAEFVSHAAAKDESQRVVALALLSFGKPEKAGEVADGILKETGSSKLLRRAAMQVSLSSKADAVGSPVAVEALKDPRTADIALGYLAMGPEAMASVEDGIQVRVSSYRTYTSGDGSVITVKPPAGLERGALQTLFKSADTRNAALAAYLLVLLGERDAFTVLEKPWRQEGMDRSEFTVLIYRAIAASNDEARTPILEEIYTAWKSDRWRLRDFYWTIRSMKGEAILKLRKRMRDEIGMEQLR